MRRINRQRREDGKHLIEKDLLEIGQVLAAQICGAFQMDALLIHLGHQADQHALLGQHQTAGVVVDQDQLFGGRKPVSGRRGVARLCQLAQACHAHGVELIEVVG